MDYHKIHLAVLIYIVGGIVGAVVGVGKYSETPKQYHIQTDEGPDRYFRFQTFNGQFRKEKRFDDGTVVGTYGWVDPLGNLRLYDYIADHLGYRIVRQRTLKVSPIVEPLPPAPPPQTFQRQPVPRPQTSPQRQPVARPRPSTRPQLASIPQRGSSQAGENLQQNLQQTSLPQAVNRPIPPTQLRPATRLRPAAQSTRPGTQSARPASQFSRPSALSGKPVRPATKTRRPTRKPLTNSQEPKLRPILVPLSQSRDFNQQVVEVQPVSPKLFSVRQPLVTSGPLQPFSNQISLGKNFIAGSINVQESSPATANFGDKETVDRVDISSDSAKDNLRGRKRVRGKPLALTRQNAALPSTKKPVTTLPSAPLPRSRGSVRFRGTPISSISSPAFSSGSGQRNQGLPSVSTLSSGSGQEKEARLPSDNFSLSHADSTSNIGKSIIGVKSNAESRSAITSNVADDLTSPSASDRNTNPGSDSFDIPPDLPYSINYDLGNQFHMEKILPDGTKVGKHGYVDPLGVLRVTHYSTGPDGHRQKQDNKWVGTRQPEQQR